MDEHAIGCRCQSCTAILEGTDAAPERVYSGEEIEAALQGAGFVCDCGRENLPAIVRQLRDQLQTLRNDVTAEWMAEIQRIKDGQAKDIEEARKEAEKYRTRYLGIVSAETRMGFEHPLPWEKHNDSKPE